MADPERIVFYRDAERPPLFDIPTVRELPRVDIVYTCIGEAGAVAARPRRRGASAIGLGSA